jgi:hypothetical protein
MPLILGFLRLVNGFKNSNNQPTSLPLLNRQLATVLNPTSSLPFFGIIFEAKG